jgi:hypothetical protein
VEWKRNDLTLKWEEAERLLTVSSATKIPFFNLPMVAWNTVEDYPRDEAAQPGSGVLFTSIP